ncbi:hypothetical protein IQ251_13815 [Saccharopolyspora sp. HNM0983]|uniref:Uncharacterized protein n=1 Tax=Saccharopolyspora montiporae TaxID=2781240 RepID=A0A929BB46_9PSEU|nr:hypothetical protein [Saccharopolyspora sp. HNM0983]MBE9375525.1 hypothetical protein [Saccharopolyspora sp. HNM0983]
MALPAGLSRIGEALIDVDEAIAPADRLVVLDDGGIGTDRRIRRADAREHRTELLAAPGVDAELGAPDEPVPMESTAARDPGAAGPTHTTTRRTELTAEPGGRAR